MATVDLKSLELIYRNAETQEELDIALAYNEISKEDFFKIAVEKGWRPNPVAAGNLAAQVESLLVPADSDCVENSNKASIRRLHSLLEFAVTRFQYEAPNLSVAGIVDSLDTLVKIRERLTKLEMPLYGLSTADPVIPTNPINIYLDGESK